MKALWHMLTKTAAVYVMLCALLAAEHTGLLFASEHPMTEKPNSPPLQSSSWNEIFLQNVRALKHHSQKS